MEIVITNSIIGYLVSDIHDSSHFWILDYNREFGVSIAFASYLFNCLLNVGVLNSIKAI